MGYMGGQSVSMGYQPYSMQVSTHTPAPRRAQGDEERVLSSLWGHWLGRRVLISALRVPQPL